MILDRPKRNPETSRNIIFLRKYTIIILNTIRHSFRTGTNHFGGVQVRFFLNIFYRKDYILKTVARRGLPAFKVREDGGGSYNDVSTYMQNLSKLV